MNLVENLHNSLHIITQNKARAFLTMLGIIIGIMGVIVILTAGNGAQSLISNQIEGIGSNLIGIFPGSGDEEGPPVSVMGIVITTLTYDDIKTLLDPARSPNVVAITSYVRGNDTMVAAGNKADSTFIGVSSQLPEVEDTGVESGNFFTEEDEKSMQKVAVLGADLKKDLFGALDPLGQLIKIGKHNFRIVGVMRERGTAGFTNQDNLVYVPITTAQKLLLGINHVSFGRAKVKDSAKIDQAVADIKQILRERHNFDMNDPVDFDVRSQKQASEIFFKITNAVKFFLAAIASLALIVGGIGIMNIMLVAVQERIREIGLRKAVGAKNRHIMFQFLLETILITSVAGVVGVIFGIIVSYLIAVIVRAIGYDWNFSLSYFSIILGVVVSSAIGFIFGLVPARRASKLDPIEALRYE